MSKSHMRHSSNNNDTEDEQKSIRNLMEFASQFEKDLDKNLNPPLDKHLYLSSYSYTDIFLTNQKKGKTLNTSKSPFQHEEKEYSTIQHDPRRIEKNSCNTNVLGSKLLQEKVLSPKSSFNFSNPLLYQSKCSIEAKFFPENKSSRNDITPEINQDFIFRKKMTEKKKFLETINPEKTHSNSRVKDNKEFITTENQANISYRKAKTPLKKNSSSFNSKNPIQSKSLSVCPMNKTPIKVNSKAIESIIETRKHLNEYYEMKKAQENRLRYKKYMTSSPDDNSKKNSKEQNTQISDNNITDQIKTLSEDRYKDLHTDIQTISENKNPIPSESEEKKAMIHSDSCENRREDQILIDQQIVDDIQRGENINDKKIISKQSWRREDQESFHNSSPSHIFQITKDIVNSFEAYKRKKYN